LERLLELSLTGDLGKGSVSQLDLFVDPCLRLRRFRRRVLEPGVGCQRVRVSKEDSERMSSSTLSDIWSHAVEDLKGKTRLRTILDLDLALRRGLVDGFGVIVPPSVRIAGVRHGSTGGSGVDGSKD
jgi:hypothetical protein